MSKASVTREHLLSIAGQVIRNQGASALTLEAVAQSAGVSKGGLLYHFPNKTALVQGMIDGYLAAFNAQVEALAVTLDGNARWFKAFIITSFDDTAEPLLMAAAIAALVNTPDLLQQIQRQGVAWRQRAIAEGVDPVTLSLVIAATDGIWYAEGFGMGVLTAEERTALLHHLLHLIEKGTNS